MPFLFNQRNQAGVSKIATIIGGLVLIALAALIVWWRWNSLAFSSSNLLTITIDGPGQAVAGDQVTYLVHYRNNGSFSLDGAELSFQIPPNAVSSDGREVITQKIGTIASGQSGAAQFSLRLLDKEGSTEKVSATVLYKPQNLSIRYQSSASFTTTIQSVPITLQYGFPPQATAGQPFSYTIEISSQMDYPLQNVVLTLDEPSQFSATSFNPSSPDGHHWIFPHLNKDDSQKITIAGQIASDAPTTIHFDARVTVRESENTATLQETGQDIPVASPAISITQLINGNSDYQPQPGELLNYQVAIKNTGEQSQNNISVSAKLSGPALDLSRFQSTDGQLDAGSQTITFNSQTSPLLANLAPGQTVTLNFTVGVEPANLISALSGSDKTVSDTVSAGGVSQTFDNQVSF